MNKHLPELTSERSVFGLRLFVLTDHAVLHYLGMLRTTSRVD